ncbi:MAG: hypothetical protein AT710_07540 [Thermocladium sp. ECH_B]|nr:MAG: hypothetical protein AT710_07540 [Thermocladium sp. ECH_B]
MWLRDALIIQLLSYGFAYAMFAHLGVNDLGIYVVSFTLIYITTMLLAEPLPPRLARINLIITAILLSISALFIARRIIVLMGGGA